MGEVRTPPLVTPLVGMLAADPAHFQAARPGLEALLGPADMVSPLFGFTQTEYYAASMGPALQRQFLSFRNLADPSHLAAWKLATNTLEATLMRALGSPGGPARPINLDVGYITGAKLVLASTKDFAHRLYLRDGIFGEITMGFRRDQWVSHAFTFPDFKSGIYDDFLRSLRERHLQQVKAGRPESGTGTSEEDSEE